MNIVQFWIYDTVLKADKSAGQEQAQVSLLVSNSSENYHSGGGVAWEVLSDGGADQPSAHVAPDELSYTGATGMSYTATPSRIPANSAVEFANDAAAHSCASSFASFRSADFVHGTPPA